MGTGSRPSPTGRAPIGGLLREWRAARRLSQLDLALASDVSARHLSCVESGKARPSRDLIDKLADALAVPLRERNALLVAAGYAPRYPESGLEARELGPVRRAIDLVLAQQEPYPAFVLNRYWDILDTNRAARVVNAFLCGGKGPPNMIRQFFEPGGLRRVVANWEEVAGDLVRHLHDAIAASPFDRRARALLDEVLAYPGVPAAWARRDLGGAAPPLLTVTFRKGETELRFFSTIATFATPRDVTIDEIRIECAFPADDATSRFCRELAGPQ
jgi:transcriptional regulator with XRE-family HTH domain